MFLALHGPFGEDGTAQALCEAAGLAYTGAGVAASAVGMDKALFKRLARGLGIPVTDWIEVRAAAWARDRDAVLGTLEAFAAGTGDPRLMVKPSRLGSSVGMMLAHDPGERGPALDLAFRYDDVALAERYLAGARDLEVSVLGNEPAEIEVFGPGEIMPGHEFYDYQAKYVQGLSETTATAEVTRDPAGRDPQARPRHVPRDRRRGVRAGGLPARGRGARRVRDQHDPRVHADQPVPGPVRGGRLRLRRGVPAGRRPRPRPRPRSHPAPPHLRGPAPMIRRSSGRAAPLARPVRPSALRPGARPGGGVRRTRRVRRASAGLTPVRAGALLAILVASAGIYGLASSNAFALRHTTITGATWTPEATILEALALPDGANLFTLEPGALERALATLPTLRGAAVTVALPDELRVDVAERAPLLVWRTTNGSYLVDADGMLFAELGPDQKEAAAALPVVDDSRLDASVLGVGSTLDPVTLDAARRLGIAVAGRRRQRGQGRSCCASTTSTASPCAPAPPAGPRCSASTRRRCARRTSSRARSGCSGACSRAGRPRVQRVILADDHSGTYVPLPTPEPTRTPRPSKSPKP